MNRRKFIKGTIAVGTGMAMAGSGILSSCSPYKSHGLATTLLGNTGVRIPRIAIGLGSRYCGIESEDEAQEMLYYALDNGLYYWDTAYIYKNKKKGIISEERIGEVLKTRRNEVFISTKVTSRDPDEAMRQIEGSLKRLKTDKLDMLKIHSVTKDEDVAKISEKGNLIDILHRLKEEGVTRFIGFSGHTEAQAMATMAERGDFDSMLIAMNHWGKENQRQEMAIPAAQKNGMGIMLMKVVRPKEKIKELQATDLVKYALSLPMASGLVLGMDSLEVLKSNIEILKSFKPLPAEKMEAMASVLTPFYRHEGLDWMEKGYCDGNWA